MSSLIHNNSSPLNDTNTLEINIATNKTYQHLISTSPTQLINKKPTSALEYTQSDDLTSFASSPTTSTSSRRSSFSSLSSSTTNTYHKRKCDSLPAKPSSSLLYPTLKSAHNRIEYLEEQIKLKRETNESIVKDFSFQIETFLKNKKDIPDPSQLEEPVLHEKSDTNDNTSSKMSGAGPATMALILDKLNELKQLVDGYNLVLKTDKVTTAIPGKQQQHYFKDEIFFSTQIIEKWVSGVTQHKHQQKKATKQVEQNILDTQKHTRLVQAIQTLSKKHTSAKKQLKCLALSETSHVEEINALKRAHEEEISKLKVQVEEKDEMEELVEEVRKEMEDIMEELNTVKLQRERYFEKSQRLESDLKSMVSNKQQGDDIATTNEDVIALQSLLRESEATMDQMEQDYQDQLDTHTTQITTLIKEKDSLKTRLATAERSVAELSLLLEVQKKQHQKPSEMEQVLRRTVAERDGELAQLKLKLEKSQRQTEQHRLHQDKQLQLELHTRLQELESSLQSQYKKESDTFQLRISREVRRLTGQVVELEMELHDLQLRHEQDLLTKTKHEQEVQSLVMDRQVNEEKLKSKVNELQQKIVLLEQDVLTLYSKNLELAQHLGDLDP